MLKPIQRNLALILFFALCLLTVYAVARAGGGGGHGGGGGGGSHGMGGRYYGHGNGHSDTPIPIIFIVVGIGWAIYGILVSLLLFVRTGLTNKLLAHISRQDATWQPALLKENAEHAFHKLQEAWQAKNMNKVKHLVTSDLYHRYNSMLNDMRARGETNVIENISIYEIKIICCRDYKDDAKDRYIAHIRGNLLDYTINGRNTIIKNEEQDNEDFEDAYYFLRSGNKWLLDHINNDPGIWDLLDAKSFSESK